MFSALTGGKGNEAGNIHRRTTLGLRTQQRLQSHAGPTLTRVSLHVQHGDKVRVTRNTQGTQQQSQVWPECKGRSDKKRGRNRRFYPSFYLAFTTNVHTHDPCIKASHALLLCKVLMKWVRFRSAAASGFAPVAVLVTPESPTAASCGYACGACSTIGGGVANRGDGDGDGDNDSGGVELVECYSGNCTSEKRQKRHVSVVRRMKRKRRPRHLALWQVARVRAHE